MLSSRNQVRRSSLVRRSNTRRRALQIHSLDPGANFSALAGQVAKVLPSNFALALHFACLLALFLQVLDVALQAFAQLVGGVFEGAADFGRDTGRVRVGVVDCGELGGEFGGEATG